MEDIPSKNLVLTSSLNISLPLTFEMINHSAIGSHVGVRNDFPPRTSGKLLKGIIRIIG